jgi:hypothetical protein
MPPSVEVQCPGAITAAVVSRVPIQRLTVIFAIEVIRR